MNDIVKYKLLVFSNSKWGKIPNRDQYLAVNMALNGHEVIFINELPSSASRLRSFFRKENIIPPVKPSPGNMKIITPPTLPTYFRSSLCKRFDRIIFKIWFAHLSEKIELREFTAVIFSPIWFYLLHGKLNLFDSVMYDICDDLRVSARNKRALKYLTKSEEEGINNSRFITCSSPKLQDYILNKYKRNSILLRNGSSNLLIPNDHSNPREKRIGLIANILNESVYDMELIELISEKYPEYELTIIGLILKKLARRLEVRKNIRMPGSCSPAMLHNAITGISAYIIPFKSNAITEKINPLKLYDCLSAGVPVVATDNFDYGTADKIIYTARNHEEFIMKLSIALKENNSALIQERMNWNVKNSWRNRAEEFESIMSLNNKKNDY